MESNSSIFDNEATISTPSYDIVKVLILQRRYDLLEALERYHKEGLQAEDLSIVEARLYTLFLELYAIIKRKYKAERFKILSDSLKKKDYASIHSNIIELLIFIDTLGLTAIDSRRVIDYADIEAVNQYKGL